jgi:hypothetical protein
MKKRENILLDVASWDLSFNLLTTIKLVDDDDNKTRRVWVDDDNFSARRVWVEDDDFLARLIWIEDNKSQHVWSEI